MRISISGKCKYLDEKIIRKALQWYAKDLMPNLHTKINLEVEVSHVLRKREGIIGAASCWHDGKKYPRNFCMEIDAALSVKTGLRILAHEMVHVKQFATGEMLDLPGGNMVRWHGKRMRWHHDERYWQLPWEIEAYGREPGLYLRFRKHTGT